MPVSKRKTRGSKVARKTSGTKARKRASIPPPVEAPEPTESPDDDLKNIPEEPRVLFPEADDSLLEVTVGRLVRSKGKIVGQAGLDGDWRCETPVAEIRRAAGGGGEFVATATNRESGKIEYRRRILLDGPANGVRGASPSHAAHETAQGAWLTLAGMTPDVNAQFVGLQLRVNHAEDAAKTAYAELSKCIQAQLALLGSYASNQSGDVVKILQSQLTRVETRLDSERALSDKSKAENIELELRARSKEKTWDKVISAMKEASTMLGEKGPEFLKKIGPEISKAMADAQVMAVKQLQAEEDAKQAAAKVMESTSAPA